MTKRLYSVTESLRIESDRSVVQAVQPNKPSVRVPPKPTIKPPPKAKFTPPPEVEDDEPLPAYGEEVRDTLLRKAVEIADEWSRRPMTAETIHNAVAEVLDLFDGARKMPVLAVSALGHDSVMCDVWRDGKIQTLPVDYKAEFEMTHIRRDYQALRETAANLQVKEDD